MPARMMRQNKEIKELFREKIREKVAKGKEQMQHRIDDELPLWISWAVKPLADYAFDRHHRRDCERGEGEMTGRLLISGFFFPRNGF